jgi:hypothetical protein
MSGCGCSSAEDVKQEELISYYSLRFREGIDEKLGHFFARAQGTWRWN